MQMMMETGMPQMAGISMIPGRMGSGRVGSGRVGSGRIDDDGVEEEAEEEEEEGEEAAEEGEGSTTEDDSEEEEEGGEEEEEGPLLSFVQQQADVPRVEDATSRLAVVNCDWEQVRAVEGNRRARHRQ